MFAEVPETLPSTLYARKLLRRAGSAGHEWPSEGGLAHVREELGRTESVVEGGEGERDGRFDAVGDLLLAVVALARELRVDPELALRAAADRYRAGVEAAGNAP